MACAFVVLTTVSTVARAGNQAQNLEPVGPHEAILTTVGSKQVIAFYEPGSGQCALHAVIWNNANADDDVSAARVRIKPRTGSDRSHRQRGKQISRSPVQCECR